MSPATPKKYYRRAEFWVALSLGPLCWGVVWPWLGRSILWWPWYAPLSFALLTVAYPLLEEIVFRGGLQGILATRLTWNWRRISAANIATSVIFALIHVVLRHDLMMLVVIFPSLVFGYFYDRERTWVPAFYLHSFYNLGYFLLFQGGVSK